VPLGTCAATGSRDFTAASGVGGRDFAVSLRSSLLLILLLLVLFVIVVLFLSVLLFLCHA